MSRCAVKLAARYKLHSFVNQRPLILNSVLIFQSHHKERFFSLVRRFGQVSDADLEIVASRSSVVQMSAGDFFLKPGQVCHRVGFVIEGVFRVFTLHENGNESIRGFSAEKGFVSDLNSYYSKTPTLEHWEALTDVLMMVWERSDIEYCEQNLAIWYPVTGNIAQWILSNNAQERSIMVSEDASTRYQKFMERYPHIIARVSLRHIANYLGIAPQSLSRIRQQLGKQ